MIKLFCLVISITAILYFPFKVLAGETNQFIVITNPVRISASNQDPKSSLKAQYKEIEKRDFPATWLLTYDAIVNDDIYSVIKTMNKHQELGIFMEVTPLFSKAANVTYNQTDSWHRSNSIFLSGYLQEDRIRYMDTVFNKFKERFGYFPSSVGAWWIDSFSLDYMKKKYNINAYLNCADQFSTDGYHLWGLPWSVPYYPAKMHSGIPASTQENKLDIVTMQWAPRDPLNGYINSQPNYLGRGSSLFSTQDYFTFELSDDYFEKLLTLYGGSNKNKFGQITIGLEADLGPGSYQTLYAKWMDIADKLQKEKEFQITNMSMFSKWYRDSFQQISPVNVIESNDLLDTKDKAIWYQSNHYRIGLSMSDELLKIRDFRVYPNDFQEPYYISPNKELDLHINIPSIIDTVSNPSQKWEIKIQNLESNYKNESLIISFNNGKQIEFKPESITVKDMNSSIPEFVKKSPLLTIQQKGDAYEIFPIQKFSVNNGGLQLKELTIEDTYLLKTKKVNLGIVMATVLMGIVFYFLARKKYFLIYPIICILIIAISGSWYCWYNSHSQTYFVSQGEMDALNHLYLLPSGKVLVYDNYCLQCAWYSKFMPAVFANKRDYVSKITKKPIIYSKLLVNASEREKTKQELKSMNVEYIYVTKNENIIEKVPFSPGDLNIKNIFTNANAEIWEVN